jgi:Glycosyl-4,4'-diaponeurosporenoate acyltransferase
MPGVTRSGRIAATYNMIPNLIWTALFFSPVAVFCYYHVSHKSIYILLAISLIPIFFPNSFFDSMQLSRKRTFYKRIGVKYINKFTQNGAVLKKYLRKKYPDLKPESTNKLLFRKQLGQTYFFEKFHFSMFVFFTAIAVYALIKAYFVWALVIFFCNLFYNIYPNLLQQYIRLRLSTAMKRTN